MKPLGSKITKCINHRAKLICIDNSGAKILRMYAVIGYKGRKNRQSKAGVGDIVMCAVFKGDPKIRDETPLAVIVRQRKEWRRPNGIRIKFDDNAAVLINESNEPRGTMIKGAIAKEIVDRYPTIGKIASVIV